MKLPLLMWVLLKARLSFRGYFQWDSYNLEGQLKVAKQHFQISVPLDHCSLELLKACKHYQDVKDYARNFALSGIIFDLEFHESWFGAST